MNTTSATSTPASTEVPGNRTCADKKPEATLEALSANTKRMSDLHFELHTLASPVEFIPKKEREQRVSATVIDFRETARAARAMIEELQTKPLNPGDRAKLTEQTARFRTDLRYVRMMGFAV